MVETKEAARGLPRPILVGQDPLYPDDGVIEVGECHVHIFIDTVEQVILNTWCKNPWVPVRAV